jgi:hypothetical protein
VKADIEENCGEDRTFTRTDPLIVEMRFEVRNTEAGNECLMMWGHAGPYISSGSHFGYCGPLKGPLRSQIDQIIHHEADWLRNVYPLRPLKVKVTRPDCRQLTLGEVVA